MSVLRNPMAGTFNLVDAMWFFLVFVIISRNMQKTTTEIDNGTQSDEAPVPAAVRLRVMLRWVRFIRIR